MAFYRARYSKLSGRWTPIAASVSQYNTRRLAKDIEKQCTVSHADVQAVLSALPDVISRYLAEGHTIKLDGIGTFYLTLQSKKTGVDRPEDVSPDQITNIKVQLRPEMELPATGRKGKRQNVLVASDMEWTLLPTKKKSASGTSSSSLSSDEGSSAAASSGIESKQGDDVG